VLQLDGLRSLHGLSSLLPDGDTLPEASSA